VRKIAAASRPTGQANSSFPSRNSPTAMNPIDRITSASSASSARSPSGETSAPAAIASGCWVGATGSSKSGFSPCASWSPQTSE
jgi:hypothetical protein